MSAKTIRLSVDMDPKKIIVFIQKKTNKATPKAMKDARSGKTIKTKNFHNFYSLLTKR